jgi:hypothetical protein
MIKHFYGIYVDHTVYVCHIYGHFRTEHVRHMIFTHIRFWRTLRLALAFRCARNKIKVSFFLRRIRQTTYTPHAGSCASQGHLHKSSGGWLAPAHTPSLGQRMQAVKVCVCVCVFVRVCMYMCVHSSTGKKPVQDMFFIAQRL